MCVCRSLAESAFLAEVGHPLKSALNSLLCALCNAHPPLYTLILSRCQEVLHQGLPLQNLLHTLAQVSQSCVATNTLLESDFSSFVMSELSKRFNWLLHFTVSTDPTQKSERTVEVRQNLKAVSLYLAFLTDFVQNWTPAKDWVGNEDNRKIWPLIFAFFCSGTVGISAVDVAFLQDVVLAFYAACVHNHSANKALVIQLFCNALQGQFDFESETKSSHSYVKCVTVTNDSNVEPGTEIINETADSNVEPGTDSNVEPGTEIINETADSNVEPGTDTNKSADSNVEPGADSNVKSGNETKDYILTPFLHKLLTELVLTHESIPLVLNCDVSILKATPTLSFCHDVVNFHPSFGVGSNRHYLALPRASTVNSLLTLINKEDEVVKPVKSVKPRPSLARKRQIAVQKIDKSPKPEPRQNWKLSAFEIRNFNLASSTLSDQQRSTAWFKPLPDGPCLDSNVKLSDIPLNPDCVVPTLQVVLESDDSKAEFPAAAATNEDLLEGFISKRGMSALAQCLPTLYPYQWPQEGSTQQVERPSQVS